MHIEYDGRTDTLTVHLRRGTIAERDRSRTGTTLAYDAAGTLLWIEVVDASRRVEQPRSVSLTTHD